MAISSFTLEKSTVLTKWLDLPIASFNSTGFVGYLEGGPVNSTMAVQYTGNVGALAGDDHESWEDTFLIDYRSKFTNITGAVLTLEMTAFDPKNSPNIGKNETFVMDSGSTMFCVTPKVVVSLGLPQLCECFVKSVTGAIEYGHMYALGLNVTDKTSLVTYTFTVPACSTSSMYINLLSMQFYEIAGWCQSKNGFRLC